MQKRESSIRYKNNKLCYGVSNFIESVLTGDQLLQEEKPLDYDQKVIQALYYGKKYQKSELPLFCTDTDTS